MTGLITLAQAKAWLNIASDQTSDDALIQELILGASSFFLILVSRDALVPTQYTERLNGTATGTLVPSNTPILSVSSLTINDRVMPVSASYGQPGYFFDEDKITLTGGGASFPWSVGGIPSSFPVGRGNVLLTYTAGYADVAITGEAVTVPSATPFQATLAQASIYTGGLALAYAAGGTLAPVSSNPAQGQYVVSATGVLTFNATDAGAALVASYNTLGIPWGIQQSTWEMTGWAYKNRDRIGITAQGFAQAGLQNTYSQAPLSPQAKAVVQQTRRKVARW